MLSKEEIETNMKEFIDIVTEGSTYRYENNFIKFNSGKEFPAKYYGTMVGDTLYIDNVECDECNIIELLSLILDLHNYVYMDDDKKIFGVDANMIIELT